MPWSFRRGAGHDERERVIRRIAQLNAEITRLQQIADEPDVDADEVESYRSVRRLRSSMAREELVSQRAELELLGGRLARLDGTLAPPSPEIGIPVPAVAVGAPSFSSRSFSGDVRPNERDEISASKRSGRHLSSAWSRRRVAVLAATVLTAGLSIVALDAAFAPPLGPTVQLPGIERAPQPAALRIEAPVADQSLNPGNPGSAAVLAQDPAAPGLPTASADDRPLAVEPESAPPGLPLLIGAAPASDTSLGIDTDTDVREALAANADVPEDESSVPDVVRGPSSPAASARTARVLTPGFSGAYLRGVPSTSGPVIALLKPGTVVQLLEGSALASGLPWQQVRAPDGAIGWITSRALA